MAGNKLKRELDSELDIDDDLRYLVNDLSNAKHKAIDLAVQLGIKKATRDAIASSAKDAEEMLRMVLEEFLQGNGSEPIIRESIITALKSASVQLPLIAQEMNKKYSTSPTGSQESYDDSSDNLPMNKQLSNSSNNAFVPQTPPTKLPCISNTEHAAERRAPTGSDVKPDYSPTNSYTTEDMSMEQQELEENLFHAIKNTKIAFVALRNKIRRICMEQKVSVQAIARIVLPCIQRDDTYPPEFKEGIKVEKSIKKLWDNIEKHTAWYRSIPIETIGVEVAKLSMDDLEEFEAKRGYIFKLMKVKYKDKETEVIKLKIDEDFEGFTDEDLKMVKITMCYVLRNTNITPFATEKGCVLISLAVPVVVAVNTFPLSPAMCEEFWQAFPSIISLACGNYRTKFKEESQDKEREEEENEESESSMAGSGEEDRNLGTHISVIRELKNAPQTALRQAASVISSSDSGFYSFVSENKSGSSGNVFAPETPPMKSSDETEHAAEGRSCPAPTDERQEDNTILKDAILECKKVFTKLRVDVCSTCISGVGYQEIKEITVPYAHSPSQLEIGLSTAKSWDSVWKYLDAYTGWENSKPIEMLAIKKGSERDSQNLDEFIRKRNWLLVLLKKNYNERTKELTLKLDVDYNEFKDENLEVVRLRLCSLLTCHVAVLKVERGCVNITVAIPAETTEDIFPLSPAMREEFQRAFPSIISVTCWKIKVQFENTHNSEEEVTESQDEEGESEKQSVVVEGYTADETGSDWSTEEEQQESREQHASKYKWFEEKEDYGEVFEADYREVLLERSPAPLPNHMKEESIIITEMSDWDPAICKICCCRFRAPFKYKGSKISSTDFTCEKKQWLRAVGSPESHIDRCEFSRDIPRTLYDCFTIRK